MSFIRIFIQAKSNKSSDYSKIEVDTTKKDRDDQKSISEEPKTGESILLGRIFNFIVIKY